MPPKKRFMLTNKTKRDKLNKLKSRERMARRKAEMTEDEREKIRERNRELRRKRRNFEDYDISEEQRKKLREQVRAREKHLRRVRSQDETLIPTTIIQPKKRSFMSKSYYEELKSYIEKRDKGQNEIPPILLSKAKFNHVASLKQAVKKRLITEHERQFQEDIFILCPGLAPPHKLKVEKDKYQKKCVLPLSIEQEVELWWKRWLLLMLNVEYEEQCLKLEDEYVELEGEDKVPHKIRGQKAQKSIPFNAHDKAQCYNQATTSQQTNRSGSAVNYSDGPSSNEWEAVSVKDEPADDGLLNYEDMAFLADDDKDDDLRRSRTEMQDWIARTVTEEEERTKLPKQPRYRDNKRYVVDQLKEKQLKALSAKLEKIRKMWIEVDTCNNYQRKKMDNERKEYELKIKQEKDTIVESIWKEFNELRAKLCQESEEGRKERIYARYEYSLQFSYYSSTAQIEAAKEKASKSQSPQLPEERAAKPYCLTTPDAKKAYNAERARIRVRMEKNEFLMYDLVVQSIKEPTIDERVKKFEDIFKEEKFQKTIEYFYKRNVVKLKSPNVLVYRKKVYLLLMKRRQQQGEISKEETIKDCLEMGAFISQVGDGVREHLQFKKEYINNYHLTIRKTRPPVDPQKAEEIRLRLNAKLRQRYQKKKLGMENSLGEYVKGPYAPYGSKKQEGKKIRKNLETSDGGTELPSSATTNNKRVTTRERKKKSNTTVIEPELRFLTNNEASSSAKVSIYAACDSNSCGQGPPHLEPQISINQDVATFYGINVNPGMSTNCSSSFPLTCPNYNESQMPYLQSVDQYLHSGANQFYTMPNYSSQNTYINNMDQFSQFPSTSTQISHNQTSQKNLETTSNFRQSLSPMPQQEVEVEAQAEDSNYSDNFSDLSNPSPSPAVRRLKRKGGGRPKGSCNLKKRIQLAKNLEKKSYSVWDYYHPNYPNKILGKRRNRHMNLNMKLASEITENPYEKIKEKIAGDLDIISKNDDSCRNTVQEKLTVANQNFEKISEITIPNQNSDENVSPKDNATPNPNENHNVKKRSHKSLQPEQRWSCKICCREIGVYPKLLRHIDQFHYSTNNFCVYKCPYNCGISQELSKLEAHIKRRHPQRSKDSWVMEISSWSKMNQAKHFICRHCPEEKFNSFANLLEHYKVHSKLRYLCDYCGICLRAEDHWQDHVSLFHPEKTSQGAAVPFEIEKSSLHQCSGCESDFSTATFLAQHIRKKHMLLENEAESSKKEIRTVVRCEHCGIVHTKFFGLSKKHGEYCKRYCFWCRVPLPSSEQLKLHLESCHPKEPPVPKNRSCFGENYIHDRYKCEICRLSYLSLFRLRVHQMTHHSLYEFMQEQKKKGEIGVAIPVPPQNDQGQRPASRSVTLEKPMGGRDKLKARAEGEPSSDVVVNCPMENCLQPICAQDVHLHHKKAEKLRRRYCFPCARLFSRTFPLDCHNAVAHGIPLQEAGKPIVYDKNLCSVKCPVCAESYPPEIFHQQHSIFAKLKDSDHRTCSLCGEEFIGEIYLKAHLLKIHGNSKKMENVDAINNTTGTKKELKEQDVENFIIVTKLKEGVEIFTCKVCMKNYKTRDFLRTHIILSHKEDAFTRISCGECNATFSTKNTLRKHVKEHHTKDKDKFICPYCSFDTLRMYRLKIHVRCIHPKETLREQDVKRISVMEVNKEKLSCKLCSRGFLSLTSLESHMTSKHFPMFDTFCDYCGLQVNPNRIALHIKGYHPEQQRLVTKTGRRTQSTRGSVVEKRLSLAESLELIHEVFSCYKNIMSNRTSRNQKRRKVTKRSEYESEEEEILTETESEMGNEKNNYDDSDSESLSQEEAQKVQKSLKTRRQRSHSNSELSSLKESENCEKGEKQLRKSKRVQNANKKVVVENSSSDESDYLPSTSKKVVPVKRNLRQSRKVKLQNAAGLSQSIKQLKISLTRCDTLYEQMKVAGKQNYPDEVIEKNIKELKPPFKLENVEDDEILVKEEFEIYPDSDLSQPNQEEEETCQFREPLASWQFIPLNSTNEDDEEMEDSSKFSKDPLAY